MQRLSNPARELLRKRRALINEIHFTHVKLERLLRAMVPRETTGRNGYTLREQWQHDHHAAQAIVNIGVELGLPAGPCVCAESEALLEMLRHADRLDRLNPLRDTRVREALRDVREFVLRSWSALLQDLRAVGNGAVLDQVTEQHRLEGVHYKTLQRDNTGASRNEDRGGLAYSIKRSE